MKRTLILLLPLFLAACGNSSPCTPKKKVEITSPVYAASVSVGRAAPAVSISRPSVPVVRPSTPPPAPRPVTPPAVAPKPSAPTPHATPAPSRDTSSTSMSSSWWMIPFIAVMASGSGQTECKD